MRRKLLASAIGFTFVLSVAMPATPSSAQSTQRSSGPSLLFDGKDLAQLRTKAKTEYGKTVLKRMSDLVADADKLGFSYGKGGPPYQEGFYAAGAALLWNVTEDRAYLDMAARFAAKAQKDRSGEFGGWGNMQRIAGLALAYDLCRADWDPALVKQVREQLTIDSGRRERKSVPDGMRDAGFTAAAGLAALAVLADGDDAQVRANLTRSVELLDALVDHLGSSGWRNDFAGYEAAMELVLPFVQAYRHSTGKDMRAGPAIARVPLLALMTDGHFYLNSDRGAAGGGDCTNAAQKAIDSGAKVVYFPHGSWRIDGTLHLRGNLQRLHFMESNLRVGKGDAPVFRLEDGASAFVTIEQLEGSYGDDRHYFEQASKRAWVLKTMIPRGGFYRSSVVGAKVFLDDVCAGPCDMGSSVVYARQLNPENMGTHVRCEGGFFWCLGLKTERAGKIVELTKGSRAEVIGGYIYRNRGRNVTEGPDAGTSPDAFINTDSSMSVCGIAGDSSITQTRGGQKQNGSCGGGLYVGRGI